MKETPITAIVVLYYSKHLVGPLLANITEKITGLDEIILVDNSNEDLSEFENTIIRVKHPGRNVGYGAAINYGIRHAKNQMIVVLNPDVEIVVWENKNELRIDECFIASGKPEEWIGIRRFPSLIYDLLRLSLKNLVKTFAFIERISTKIPLNDLTEPKSVDWVSGSLIITNKKTMNIIKGFDEEYFLFYEEIDLCKRAALKNIPRCILPDICFKMNQGTSSKLDVNQIKFSSEIKSAKRYHSHYFGEIITKITFVVFKLYCLVVWFLMSLAGFALNQDKIVLKSEQYKAYYKAV